MPQTGCHGYATTGSDYVITIRQLEQFANWNSSIIGARCCYKKSVAFIAVYSDKINDLAIDHLLAGMFEIHSYIFADD